MTRQVFVVQCLAITMVLLQAVSTQSSIAAQSPQMGWNTWNTFKSNISETLIEDTADLFESLGLKDAGYGYLIIDEGWQAMSRDSETGRQIADAVKFPSGIKPLADSIHSKGLKLGIYSDAGIYDCGFYPGSWGNEELDADTYAAWGIDYLKYDNCGSFQAGIYSPYERFAVMRDALHNTDRDILYSLCNWGSQFPWFWADQIGQSFRMSGDIHNAFATDNSGVCKTAYCLNTGYAGCSVLTIIRKMRELSMFQKPGAWLDMDMLEIGNGVLNEAQERTHFSFWAALKSPLIIGTDLRNIAASSLRILKQKDLIAANQDPLGKAISFLPDLSHEGEYQIWAGQLQGGRSIILVFNEGQPQGFSTFLDMRKVLSIVKTTSDLNDPLPHQAKEVWSGEIQSLRNGKLNVDLLQWNETAVYIVD
jgi:alpha-galactosidase